MCIWTSVKIRKQFKQCNAVLFVLSAFLTISISRECLSLRIPHLSAVATDEHLFLRSLISITVCGKP